MALQLCPDLRARPAQMRVDVRVVGELVGQERARVRGFHGVSARDRTEKASVGLAHEHDRCAERRDQRNTLAAHPVRHEDRDGVPQRAADGRKRDAGIAARGFRDRIARRDLAGRIRKH